MSDEKDQKERKEEDPGVQFAMSKLTPEQREEYKKIGEYMYTTDYQKINQVGSQVTKMNEMDLVVYASQGLQAGLNPMDLTREEVQALNDVYGPKWFERFDLSADEVPKPFVETMTESLENLPRQQRRALEREANKRARQKGRVNASQLH